MVESLRNGIYWIKWGIMLWEVIYYQNLIFLLKNVKLRVDFLVVYNLLNIAHPFNSFWNEVVYFFIKDEKV